MFGFGVWFAACGFPAWVWLWAAVLVCQWFGCTCACVGLLLVFFGLLGLLLQLFVGFAV